MRYRVLFAICLLGPFCSFSQVSDSSAQENPVRNPSTIQRTTDAGNPVGEIHKGAVLVTTPSSRYSFLRNYNQPVRKKIGRAEFLIGSVEAAGMVTLILMPKSITKWNDGWAHDAVQNVKRAFTIWPVWDKDDWAINYIGHPVAGAYYYNALRSQNATLGQSFLFSFIQSTFWEYVIEGVAERPSIQDIISTPVGGAIMGELTHQMTLQMAKNNFNFLEKVAVIILNPMYVMNNGFNKRLNRVRY